MEVNYILGNDFVGIRSVKSEESDTITYSITLLILRLEISSGLSRFYNELTFSVLPMFSVSITLPG